MSTEQVMDQVKQEEQPQEQPRKKREHGESDPDDELTEDSSSEREEEEKPKKKRRPFDNYEFLADEDGVHQIHLVCRNKECKNEFDANEVETVLKVGDGMIGAIDELEGGHIVLRTEIVLKRRTFVECPACQQRHMLKNEQLDREFGQILGDVMENFVQEDVATSAIAKLKEMGPFNHFSDTERL